MTDSILIELKPSRYFRSLHDMPADGAVEQLWESVLNPATGSHDAALQIRAMELAASLEARGRSQEAQEVTHMVSMLRRQHHTDASPDISPSTNDDFRIVNIDRRRGRNRSDADTSGSEWFEQDRHRRRHKYSCTLFNSHWCLQSEQYFDLGNQNQMTGMTPSTMVGMAYTEHATQEEFRRRFIQSSCSFK